MDLREAACAFVCTLQGETSICELHHMGVLLCNECNKNSEKKKKINN